MWYSFPFPTNKIRLAVNNENVTNFQTIQGDQNFTNFCNEHPNGTCTFFLADAKVAIIEIKTILAPDKEACTLAFDNIKIYDAVQLNDNVTFAVSAENSASLQEIINSLNGKKILNEVFKYDVAYGKKTFQFAADENIETNATLECAEFIYYQTFSKRIQVINSVEIDNKIKYKATSTYEAGSRLKQILENKPDDVKWPQINGKTEAQIDEELALLAAKSRKPDQEEA